MAQDQQPTLSSADVDVERASSSGTTAIDPFNLQNGVLPEDEIAMIRKRKKGKAVAKYQHKQNDASDLLLECY